jgi:putative oxidoreductase
MNVVNVLRNGYDEIVARLQGMQDVLPLLTMRLVMGWEFFEAGLQKLRGDNWFSSIQSDFPFPFSHVPASFSWGMATWFELLGGIALWLGLFTRFVAFSLLILTFVATAAVHWPDMISMWSDLLKGYAISDDGHGNFKLPLLFVVMLLPLIFSGAGRLSMDQLLRTWVRQPLPAGVGDAYAVALTLAILGLPMLLLLPTLGALLCALAVGAALFQRFARG